jgi:hypothetical protein
MDPLGKIVSELGQEGHGMPCPLGQRHSTAYLMNLTKEESKKR